MQKIHLAGQAFPYLNSQAKFVQKCLACSPSLRFIDALSGLKMEYVVTFLPL